MSAASGEAPSTRPPETVDRLIAYQWDPTRPSLGGVDTCLRGLATYQPSEVAVGYVGVDATGTKPLGQWQRLPVSTSGREVWFLPVARLDPDSRRRTIPHGVQLAWGLWRYRRVLPRPRIIQAHKLESAVALRALFRSAGLVYFIHSQGGALASRGSDSGWRLLGRLHARWERRIVRRADSVVVFNPDYAQELSHVSPRVHARSTWFDSRMIRTNPSRDPYRVVWAGRMEGPKNPHLALSMFSRLVRDHPEQPWALTMLGGGSLLGDVRAAATALPSEISERVTVAGPVPPNELAEVFAGAGVLLMTTEAGYEGVPRVLVEGLASGLVAVVTDGSDTGGLIRDGRNGFVRDRDPGRLAQAVADSVDLDRDAVRSSAAHLDGRQMVPDLFALTTADVAWRSES